jgi:hypothetical protein
MTMYVCCAFTRNTPHFLHPPHHTQSLILFCYTPHMLQLSDSPESDCVCVCMCVCVCVYVGWLLLVDVSRVVWLWLSMAV